MAVDWWGWVIVAIVIAVAAEGLLCAVLQWRRRSQQLQQAELAGSPDTALATRPRSATLTHVVTVDDAHSGNRPRAATRTASRPHTRSMLRRLHLGDDLSVPLQKQPTGDSSFLPWVDDRDDDENGETSHTSGVSPSSRTPMNQTPPSQATRETPGFLVESFTSKADPPQDTASAYHPDEEETPSSHLFCSREARRRSS